MAKTEPKTTTTDPAEASPDDMGDVAGAAAQAAVADLDADENTIARGVIASTNGTGDVEFTFKKKRIDSVQFRRLMQRRADILAIEFLVGPLTLDRMLIALADEDGETPESGWGAIWQAINEAVGEGN